MGQSSVTYQKGNHKKKRNSSKNSIKIRLHHIRTFYAFKMNKVNIAKLENYNYSEEDAKNTISKLEWLSKQSDDTLLDLTDFKDFICNDCSNIGGIRFTSCRRPDINYNRWHDNNPENYVPQLLGVKPGKTYLLGDILNAFREFSQIPQSIWDQVSKNTFEESRKFLIENKFLTALV